MGSERLKALDSHFVLDLFHPVGERRRSRLVDDTQDVQARDLAGRRQLIEDYYGAYRQRVIDDPHQHGMGYVHAYMTISKV